MISADIFEDEFTGQLNYFERLLWIGLFATVADDQGRMIDSTALIRARVFLYDKVSDAQAEKALIKLAAADKIIRYKKDNKILIQIVKWWTYQTPSWASASKHSAPDNWIDRVKCHAKGKKIIMLNWDKKGGLHNPLPSPLPSPLHSALLNPLHRVEPEGIHSSIDDVKVKGEVKVKVKVKGEVEVNNYTAEDLIRAFVINFGAAGDKADETAAGMQKKGVTTADIIKAIEFMEQNPDKYTCVDFKSIRGPATIEMQKRIAKEKIPDKEDPERYIKGEYGNIGNH